MEDMAVDAQSELVLFFKALSDATRLRIAGRLAQADCTAETLAEWLGEKPLAVKHHLGLLLAAGLVEAVSGVGGARGPVYHLRLAGHYVGALSLISISQGHCEIGYEIEPEFRRRGIASEAVHAVVRSLNVGLLSAQARSDNLASRRILEKSGFALASSKLVWSYGEEAPLQIMAYHLHAPTTRLCR